MELEREFGFFVNYPVLADGASREGTAGKGLSPVGSPRWKPSRFRRRADP
ncbi:hypothetical protein [Tardisphaera saccharovorans]